VASEHISTQETRSGARYGSARGLPTIFPDLSGVVLVDFFGWAIGGVKCCLVRFLAAFLVLGESIGRVLRGGLFCVVGNIFFSKF
jgi:hypothetical protein